MMQVLTLAKKDQPETEEQRQHAETANNNDGTAAEPFAAAHEGPLAAGEASSRSDGQDDPKSGVAILSQLLGNTASDLDLEIARLKAQREEMKKSKKRCAAELKNTERKRTRLKNRAKLLSTKRLAGGVRHALQVQRGKGDEGQGAGAGTRARSCRSEQKVG